MFLYPNSATSFLCESCCVFLINELLTLSVALFANTSKEAKLQEKLRRKAELQKQARRPMGYSDSMEAEKRKQQSLQKTKEERRIALCEELGRGC